MTHSTSQRPRALIAGGGSGGHVFPGLAVARELESRGWDVSWAGAASGMEENLVGRHKIDFHSMRCQPLVGRSLVEKAKALATVTRSGIEGRSLIKSLGADVVLGTGGYVSAPAVLGARLAGVPALLLEPNAEAGVANRMLSRWAKEALVAHDTTAASLDCPVTVTGVPVRDDFFAVAHDLPFGQPWRVLVLGGSQGAQQLNTLMPLAFAALPEELGSLLVRHQTGQAHIQEATEHYTRHDAEMLTADSGGHNPEGGRLQVEVVAFIHDVAAAMAESHLIVSRAGAITLAEICAAGRPALLAPLTIAGGHQERNAQLLATAGAARVLPSASTAEAVAELLAPLLAERRGLETMAAAARALGRPRAAADIADRLVHWRDK